MSKSIHTTVKSWAAHRGKRELDAAVSLGDPDLDDLAKKRQYKDKTLASRKRRVVRRRAK